MIQSDASVIVQLKVVEGDGTEYHTGSRGDARPHRSGDRRSRQAGRRRGGELSASRLGRDRHIQLRPAHRNRQDRAEWARRRLGNALEQHAGPSGCAHHRDQGSGARRDHQHGRLSASAEVPIAIEAPTTSEAPRTAQASRTAAASRAAVAPRAGGEGEFKARTKALVSGSGSWPSPAAPQQPAWLSADRKGSGSGGLHSPDQSLSGIQLSRGASVMKQIILSFTLAAVVACAQPALVPPQVGFIEDGAGLTAADARLGRQFRAGRSRCFERCRRRILRLVRPASRPTQLWPSSTVRAR